RKNQWIIDKHEVERSNEGELYVKGESNYGLSNNYGFFIQDNLQTLDKFGEWYQSMEEGVVYLYVGDQKDLPSSLKIKVGSIDNLLTNKINVKYVVVQNLCFSGANKSGISLKVAKSIVIKDCTIEYSGENALTAVTVPDLTLTGNKIQYAQNNGIFLQYGTPKALIDSNIIENIHVFAGMG